MNHLRNFGLVIVAAYLSGCGQITSFRTAGNYLGSANPSALDSAPAQVDESAPVSVSSPDPVVASPDPIAASPDPVLASAPSPSPDPIVVAPDPVEVEPAAPAAIDSVDPVASADPIPPTPIQPSVPAAKPHVVDMCSIQYLVLRNRLFPLSPIHVVRYLPLRVNEEMVAWHLKVGYSLGRCASSSESSGIV